MTPRSQTKEHMKTIKQSAGDRARVLPMLLDYLARSGVTIDDFARRINYAPQTLWMFANDRYHHIAGTHRILCRAILDYIERNPIEPPQQMFGDLYDTANVRLIRQTIQKLLRRPVAYLLYAPPGSQKSFALEHEIARLNREEVPRNGHGRRAFYCYATEKIKPTQLMKEVAISCGIHSIGDMPRIARNLAYEFRNRRVLLVIDEAQHLEVSCLEAIRVLLDRPPHFSLLLSGSHDLKTKFDRYSGTLEQWNSRIIDKVLLPGLERDEARSIVQREIGDLLSRLDERKATAKAEAFIDAATTKDAFERGRTYINVRTLTNALDQYKDAKRAD